MAENPAHANVPIVRGDRASLRFVPDKFPFSSNALHKKHDVKLGEFLADDSADAADFSLADERVEEQTHPDAVDGSVGAGGVDVGAEAAVDDSRAAGDVLTALTDVPPLQLPPVALLVAETPAPAGAVSGNTPQLHPVILLASGAIAGGVAKTVTAPVDRVKILYQVDPSRPFTMKRGMKTFRTIVGNTGAEGLWRGNGSAMARVLPYASIHFMAFDYNERLLKTYIDEKNVTTRFLAGALAGATATSLTYPFDLVRARMAAHWSLTPKYEKTFPLKRIVMEEGVRGLFRGIWPTLLGILPYSGVGFATYETLKEKYRDHNGLEERDPFPTTVRLAAGGFAGGLATFVTYPLHVVRRRMQVQASQDVNRYSGVIDALTKIKTKEGLAGFYKGITLSAIKGPVGLGISFTVNDLIKRYFLKQVEEAPDDVLPATVTGGEISDIRSLTALETMCAGGIAGGLAKTIIAPGDRVKILYQVNPDRKFSLTSAMRTANKIVQHSGVVGLWRGNGATLLRVIPHSAISYMTYERYQTIIMQMQGETSGNITNRFFAGAAAGATATTITYPLDLLRARMAAHWSTQPMYTNYLYAISHIVNQEGLTVLWHGLWPTLLGVMPYAGLSFAIFHTAKAKIVTHLQLKNDKDIPTLYLLTAGGVAGLLAQSVTYPLDIVRRRMQVHGRQFDGIGHVFRVVYEKEGLRGFFKGLSMNWIKGPIAVAVSFTTNDFVKSQLYKMHTGLPAIAHRRSSSIA